MLVAPGSREPSWTPMPVQSGLRQGALRHPDDRQRPTRIASAVQLGGRRPWAGKARSASAFPAVLKDGLVLHRLEHRPVLHRRDAVELFSNATGREVVRHQRRRRCRVWASTRFGDAVQDEMGTVIVLTFGTGIGSAHPPSTGG